MNPLLQLLAVVVLLAMSGAVYFYGRKRCATILSVLILLTLFGVTMTRDASRIAHKNIPSPIMPKLPVSNEPSPNDHAVEPSAKARSVASATAMKRGSTKLGVLERQRPIEVLTLGFVGSDACTECHQDNHASWKASYHRTMTQIATPDSVIGNFDDVQITARGRKYILTMEDETFMVDMPNEEDLSKRMTVPVVMTTGSHHMQVYWFASAKTTDDRNVTSGLFERDPRMDPQGLSVLGVLGVRSSSPFVRPWTLESNMQCLPFNTSKRAPFGVRRMGHTCWRIRNFVRSLPWPRRRPHPILS